MSNNKRLLIDATHSEETRVIIADENRIHEFDISATSKTQNKGNIYLAKVTRVEPSLQAAFVEYGGDRQGFLPFSEIHPDYYQIPVADRQKLIEEVAAEEEQENEDDDEQEQSENGRNNRGGRGRRGRRRGGRGRSRNNNEQNGDDNANDDAANHDDAVEDKAKLTEEDVANTYLEEPIAENPSVKSDVVEDILEDIEEVKKEQNAEKSKKKDARAEDEDGSDEAEEIDTAGDEKDVLESLGDDDEFTRRRKASFLRRYKIQEVIKRNQVMLVQVIKEERGNKGASLSTYISLAGRYCVLMPNSPKTGGISRKISSSEDRKRLKAISEEIRSNNGMSAIIRTAGIDRTRAEIKRDYDYLIKLWSQIRELTLSSTAPAVVHEEADIVKRSLRDLYSSDIKEVVVAGEEAYKRAKEFMKLMMPSHAARVKSYNDNTPIFYAYDAEDQLLRMHEPQVKLESGGSIVLNPTEALVSIDVNSGRSTTERNVEETAVKTNLEAAQEIARQVRLRDLAGLIVIDFIDMFDYKNRRAVERQLKEALKADRAKIQVGRISAFGLLEMSRQRLRPSLTETNTLSCPHCEGRGFILNADAQGIQMLRFLEKEASAGEYAHLKLKVQPGVALYLLNNKRDHLIELEKTHKLKISIEIGEGLISSSSFMLERFTAEGQKTEVNGMDGIPTSGKRNRSRKRKRGGRDNSDNDNNNSSNHKHDSSNAKDNDKAEKDSDADAKSDKTSDNDSDDKGERQGRRRRRGGRRRGGRNRDRDQQQDNAADNSGNEPKADKSDDKKADDKPVAAEKPQQAEVKSDKDNAPEKVAEKSEEKKPRRRGGRSKKADVKADGDTADAKPAESKPAKEKADAPAAKEEKAEKKPSAAASKPATPSKKKELETVGGDDSGKGDAPRKGWWRRIVE
jgi:ribonuclease E